MSKKVIHQIETPKGIVIIQTELREGQQSPMWVANLVMPGGIVFPMIRRNSEISTSEALKMI